MTEYELYEILLNYAGLYENRYEFFIGATVAMVVAIFISAGKLNIYLRWMVICLYSAFSISQYLAMSSLSFKVDQIVKSIEIVTADQINKLPITDALFDITITSSVGFTSYIMFFAWAGCSILMAWPKFIKV